jgi:glyoxylase-like metal-dependent hydrolase (beta-lactamase superfamily II)
MDINGMKIRTIDCNYFYPEFAASYLLIDGGQAAFIDNNTVHAVPLLMSALEEEGLRPEQVMYIIVTHVHLDHSGGTAALLARCPSAKVIAHERAARHIIDPSRLVEGATAVYGSEMFEKIYGKIRPADAKMVGAVSDGETLKFGARSLRFIYTLGHAKHHMCIFDVTDNIIFTGDSFGLAYPFLQTGRRPFIFPSTTPVDFDPDMAIAGVRKIVDTGAGRVFPAHYGPVREISSGAEMMIDYLGRMKGVMTAGCASGASGDGLYTFCLSGVDSFFQEELEKRGLPYSAKYREFLKLDADLNAKGIAHASMKLRGDREKAADK